MKLDRLIFINWGHMAPGTYDMGLLTLLTGPTGVGKSTVLDGMQIVMTAAHRQLLQLNPGQDETGQAGASREKTRRTLEGYIVGAEKNLFARPHGAHGYIAAVFQPDLNEDSCKPFTAVVAASARVEGAGDARYPKPEGFALYILDGSVAVEEDFLPDADTGVVIPVESIGHRLRQKYKTTEFHDRKADYLSALYGRFRGRATVPREEAMQAARAWVQSIAYRRIGAVHELVRDEILDLDKNQLIQDIERIGGLMKDVASLRREGARLQQNATLLTHLQGSLQEVATAHEQHRIYEVFVARLRLHAEKEEESSLLRKIEDFKHTISSKTDEINRRATRRIGLDEQRIQLSARMLGIPVKQQKTALEVRLTTANNDATARMKSLSEAVMAASILDRRAQAVLAAKSVAGFDRLTDAIAAVANAYRSLDLRPLHETSTRIFAQAEASVVSPTEMRDIALQLHSGEGFGLDALFDAVVGQEGGLMEAVAEQVLEHKSALGEAKRRVEELTARRATLARGEVEYPPPVKVAMRVLQERFPDAMPQVLCDLIEPRAEAWQPAIEGYLRGARFNILVKPEWETRVLNFAREKNWREVKIIQGRLSLKDLKRHGPPPTQSIVHELDTRNEVAIAYLASQFGAVVKVATVEELQSTKRGLMRDGRASGSRTYFLADAKEMVFGAKSRKRQLDATIEDLRVAEGVLHESEKQEHQLAELRASLNGIQRPVLDVSDFGDVAEEIDSANRALSALDVSEITDLQDSLDQLNEEILKIDAGSSEDIGVIATTKSQLNSASDALSGNKRRRDQALEGVQTATQALGSLALRNSSLSYAEMSARADELAISEASTLAAVNDKLLSLGVEPKRLLTGALQHLAQYHQQCRADEQFRDALSYPGQSETFDKTYDDVVKLQGSVGLRLTMLRSTGIFNNQLELTRATESFNDVFTKHFCAEIKTRVDDGIRTLRQMNQELKNLSFGHDTFVIDWSQWEPELREYLEFFQAVAELTESADNLDLFADDTLTAQHVEVRDRLIGLLLSEDQERAQKDLLRIADYRNYRRYDIICESPNGRVRLSTWGTGSGGQMETPAYIVRAAVVTNRLKIFEKGPSLRFLVNDEAFSKMDEARARAVLCFMRDKLNLQVVSAMPTMKAGPLKDEFNKEFNFTQLKPVSNGELDFCVEVKELSFKQDKMRELWALHRQNVRERAKELFEQEHPVPAVTALEPNGAAST